MQALGRPTSHWDDLLVYIITSKFDFFTIKEWESSLNTTQSPKFQELTDFLNRRCQMLEAVARRSSSIQFLGLSVPERFNQVKSRGLCLNCLKGNHIAKDCSGCNCKKYEKKHSTLLHDDRDSSKGPKQEQGKQGVSHDAELNKAENVICNHSQLTKSAKTSQVLLSTALVKIRDQAGQYTVGRALLDNDSQSNFITEEFASKLGLKLINNRIEVKGVNQHVSQAMKSTNLRLTSRFDTFEMELECIVLPEITQNVPTFEFEKASCNIPENIKLADPQFNLSGKIDLLIGAERFWEIICVGQIRLGKNQPILQKSLLGWLISGTIVTSTCKKTQTSCNLSLSENLNDIVHKFWEVESCTNTVRDYRR